MPSYDIIPLASDLLDYTIQRVKQKEAEYKPVKDAHAAHGNTWSLRQQVRDRVQNILKEEI